MMMSRSWNRMIHKRIPISLYVLLLILHLLLLFLPTTRCTISTSSSSSSNRMNHVQIDHDEDPTIYRINNNSNEATDDTTTTEHHEQKEQQQEQESSSSSYIIQWLDQLQLHIPDMTFTKDYITINILNLTCTHFHIYHIQSNYIPSSQSNSNNNTTIQQQQQQLHISIQNISASCTGLYSISSSSVHGIVTIQIGNVVTDDDVVVEESTTTTTTTEPSLTNNNALEWTFVVHDMNTTNTNNNNNNNNNNNSNTMKQPNSIQTIDCQINIQVIALNFIGNISAKILQLFHTIIITTINHIINEQINIIFDTKIDTIISFYIQQFIHLLQPYLINSNNITNTNNIVHTKPYRHNYHENTNEKTTSTANNTNNTNSTNNTKPKLLLQYNTDIPIFMDVLNTINTFISNHLYNGFIVPNNNSYNTSSSTSNNNHLFDINNNNYYHHHDPFLPSSLSTTTATTTRRTSTSTLTSSCGGLSDGINGLLRDLIGISSFTIPYTFHPISIVIPHYTSLLLHIHNITLLFPTNQYNVNQLSLLRPQTIMNNNNSNETYFHNEINLLSNITIQILISMNISDIPNGIYTNKNNISLNETFSIQINLQQLHIMFNILLNWKLNSIQNIITLDMIYTLLFQQHWSDPTNNNSNTSQQQTKYAIDCIKQGIDQISVFGLFTKVDLSHISIQPISTSTPKDSIDDDNSNSTNQSLENDIDQLINTILELIITEYPVLITSTISGFITTNNTIQNLINHYFDQWIHSNNTDKNTTNSSSGTMSYMNWDTIDESLSYEQQQQWLNFSKINLLHQMNTYLNQTTTMIKFNQYIDCTMDRINEMMHPILIGDDHYDVINPTIAKPTTTTTATTIESNRSNIQIIDFMIKRIGQFQKIELVLPNIDGYHLQNSFLWDKLVNDTESHVSDKLPQLFMSIGLNYAPLNVTAIIDITILLNDIQWGIDTLLHFDVNEFKQMTLMQLFSHAQCILLPMNTADFVLSGMEHHFQFLQMIVNTSLTMIDQNETINIVIDTNDYPSIQAHLSPMYEWVVDTTNEIIGTTSKSILQQSVHACERIPSNTSTPDNNFNSNDTNYDAKPMLLILLAVFMFLQPTILFIKRTNESIDNDQVQRLNDNDLMEPLLLPNDHHHHHRDNQLVGSNESIHDDVADDNNHVDYVDNHDSDTIQPESNCFMINDNIPILVQYGIPIAIMSTIVLLLCSNLSVGATVDIVITNIFETKRIQVPSVFEFSLYNTARDMLKAKIYPLFFLVLIFSGMWPYMKLFLMLFAWIGPTSLISPTFRGNLLLKLDALSKFSLVDTYVLIVMMIAFQYHLPLIEESSSFDVFVVPKFGFYGFLIATSLSLVLGHVLVYYHRRIELLSWNESDKNSNDISSVSPIAMTCNHPIAIGFQVYSLENGSTYKVSNIAQYMLLALLVLVLTLLRIGITQKCFVFEFGGLAGILLSNGKNRSEYSVLSFASAILYCTEHSLYLSTQMLQLVFYFYTVVMPFTSLILLSVLWTVPMSTSYQYAILILAEIANAWSALEVFCLSILAALFEIQTFANFMIGHKCDLINQVLLSHQTTIGINTCYEVTTTVSWNAMYLVFGAILHLVLVSFILRFVQSSIHVKFQQAIGNASDSHPGQCFIQQLARSDWGVWIFDVVTSSEALRHDDVSINAGASNTNVESDIDIPVFSDLVLTTPWEDNNKHEWKNTVVHGPTWKEWNETTNVT